MAPESLQYQKYSRATDVYSFGITLWEIWTAKLPYDGIPPPQAAIDVVYNNLRPDISEFPSSLASLLKDCWASEPPARPTFQTIYDRLQLIEFEIPTDEIRTDIQTIIASSLQNNRLANSAFEDKNPLTQAVLI